MAGVSFDLASAQRIYRAVRTVEMGNRDQQPLRFRRVLEQPKRQVFRVCTFDGPWQKEAYKTVTFKYQTSTPNTVNALNLFFPITENAVQADCSVAKEGTSWFLIDVPFQTATIALMEATTSGFFAQATASAVFAEGISQIEFLSSAGSALQSFVTDISLSAELDTTDCTITVGSTLATQSVAIASADGTQTALVVSATATGVSISSAATAIFATQTSTATVLRFKVM